MIGPFRIDVIKRRTSSSISKRSARKSREGQRRQLIPGSNHHLSEAR
jgi:hypothetical protein